MPIKVYVNEVYLFVFKSWHELMNHTLWFTYQHWIIQYQLIWHVFSQDFNFPIPVIKTIKTDFGAYSTLFLQKKSYWLNHIIVKPVEIDLSLLQLYECTHFLMHNMTKLIQISIMNIHNVVEWCLNLYI